MSKIKLDGDGARQGETPKRVRYVLAFGLLGVIGAFALVAGIA
jgi:hypothetical protein